MLTMMYIIGVLLAVIGALLTRLLVKFEELIKNLAKANEILVAHQTRLDNMDHRFDGHSKKLDDHAARLRDVELGHAACKYNGK